MSHVAHELADEFPDDHPAIHALKSSNAHFAKLYDRHHSVNREVHRIESGVEPASDDRLEALKKLRLALLDEVSAMLVAAKGT